MTKNEFDTKQTVTSSEEYKVGYRRPPKHSQFRKGQSGNRNGRPKGKQNLKDQLLEVYTGLVDINVDGKRRRVPRLVAAAMVQSKRALTGDVRSQVAMFKNVAELGGFDQNLEPSVPETVKNELTQEELDRLTVDQLDLIIGAEKIINKVVASRSIH